MTLENDLAAVIARHPRLTGREFVAACIHAAEAYFEATDLPSLVDAEQLLAAFAEGLREELTE